MPIVTFHLAENCCTDAQTEQLIEQASAVYAEVLDSPIERVRVFIKTYPGQQLGVAGKALAPASQGAPFFEFLVLQGRPKEQRFELMLRFTRLIAEISGVEQSLVRGFCTQLDPDDWCIGGIPATEMRKGEIAARAQSAGS